MRPLIAPLALLSSAIVLAGCGEDIARPRVAIATDHGTVVCELFPEQAPQTVANFLGLAAGTRPFKDPHTGEEVTRPFYDGLVFHRVIGDFMIQGGCPLGRGSGGPGYTFADEINATSLGLDRQQVLPDGVTGELNPRCAYLEGPWFHRAALRKMEEDGWTPRMDEAESQRYYTRARTWLLSRISRAERFEKYGHPLPHLAKLSLKQFYEELGYTYRDDLPPSTPPVKGSLCMANSGPDTNGSQFFLLLEDKPHLAGKHTVFGRVVSGMDVVERIGAVPVSPGDHRPLEPVTITSVRPVRE